MSNSITSSIRKSRAVVSIILFAFVVGYLAPYMSDIGYNMFSSSKVNVGTIAGTQIPYSPDYRYQFDIMLRNEIQRYGHYKGIEANVHRAVWEQFVQKNAFSKTYERLGIAVLTEEREDMLLGNDIPMSIQGSIEFQDPKTKKFDKGKYLNFIKYIGKQPGGEVMLGSIERQIILSRFQDKLRFLVTKSIHTSHLSKRKKEKLNEPMAIRYLYIPYASIADSRVRNAVTEQDKQAYYKTHQQEFVQKESKDIEYVIFPVLCSSEDVNKAAQELEAIKEKFAKAKEPEAFAKLYSDNPKEIVVRLEKEALPEYIKSKIKGKKKDQAIVIGPVEQGSTYILYRYMGTTSSSSWTFQKQKKMYLFIKIERKVAISEHSYDKQLKEVRAFLAQVKRTGEWKETAEKEYGLYISKDTIPLTQAKKIGQGDYRKLIRWLYNEAKPGVPSPAIEIKDRYYVAILSKEHKAGTAPFAKVEEKIEKALFNKEKARMIKEKLGKIDFENRSLDKVAKTYGPNASVGQKQRVYFEDNEINGHQVPRVIGALFGLKVGERTQCIEGKDGIYIVQRIPKMRQAKAKRKTTQSQQEEKRKKIIAKELEIVRNFILNYYETIEDWRYRFYD